MRIADKTTSVWAARPMIIAALLCVPAPLFAATTKTSARCGADQEQPPGNVFADFEGRGKWQEYPDVKAVPAVQNDAGSYVQVWAGKDGNVLIATDQPGEDFRIYTDYCFDKSGRLTQLRFELRTAWGWGYREEGAFAKGKIVPEIAEFFNVETGKPVARPDGAADIPKALKPHIYHWKAELPFFDLLSS